MLRKILLGALIVLSVPAHAEWQCQTLFLPRTRVFAFGAHPEMDTNAHIQLGFEAEYAFDEIDGLLKYYEPKFTSEAQADNWKELTLEQKRAWVHERYQIRPEFAQTTELHLIRRQPETSFLPELLILDSTGNLELVLSPVDSFQEWERQTRWVNQNIGVGSMQAMLSSPREFFFGHRLGLSQEQALKENLGWFTFTAELDTLNKLENGARKFAQDPSKEVARSFAHPWLGPLTRLKWEKLRDFLSLNFAGNGFDTESLKFVKNDASFKFIGGSAYRPDIGAPDRVGVELRSAHKDYPLLRAQVLRDMRMLASDRSAFADFSAAPPFDSKLDFSKLPDSAQTMLSQLFPAKVDPRFRYTNDERLAVEVYRNFAYPLRNWTPVLAILKADKQARKDVMRAKSEYVVALDYIASQFHRQEIGQEKARVLTEGALAQFAVSSGLLAMYREFLAQVSSKLDSWPLAASGF